MLKLTDLTLPSPALNLAADEALLDHVERSGKPGVLRFWESPTYFVVIGYSKRIQSEVELETCATRGIPILRRCSGGGTVLQGPGCLNYSLILPIDPGSPLQSITETNRWIMARNANALSRLLGNRVEVSGCTDLTIGTQKFSGNAQRRRQRTLLFHGTFLLSLDLELMSAVLRSPEDQPSYRNHRSHAEFLTTLPPPATAQSVRNALSEEWEATKLPESCPRAEIERLSTEKYSSTAWTRKY